MMGGEAVQSKICVAVCVGDVRNYSVPVKVFLIKLYNLQL
jgi:hypothetical protein